LRLVLFSVTEGLDKPLKYPTIFNTSDAAIISKFDLRKAVEFYAPGARRNILAVHPGMPIFELSAKTGQGFERVLTYLQKRFDEFRTNRFTTANGASQSEFL
jgi:hydrogenase nickel incorporation protein HypB